MAVNIAVRQAGLAGEQPGALGPKRLLALIESGCFSPPFPTPETWPWLHSASVQTEMKTKGAYCMLPAKGIKINKSRNLPTSCQHSCPQWSVLRKKDPYYVQFRTYTDLHTKCASLVPAARSRSEATKMEKKHPGCNAAKNTEKSSLFSGCHFYLFLSKSAVRCPITAS